MRRALAVSARRRTDRRSLHLMWKHLTLILRAGPNRPLVSIDHDHEQVVANIEKHGWEAVGLTTLNDGAVMMLFKKPTSKDDVGLLDESVPASTPKVQIGIALPGK
jgi:hypothetical protein